MSNERELLIAVSEMITGKSTEELQELLYEKSEESEELTLKKEAKELLSEFDANRITSLKTKITEEWETKLDKVKNDHLGRGKKEALTSLEKDLKEKFGVTETDKKGLELIDDIVAKAQKKTIGADEIKKTPEYLELESKLQNEYVPKSELETIKSEFDTFKSGLERNKVMSVVNSKALEVFRNLKPRLSDDANKRANQENIFLNSFVANGNYQVDGDKILLLDEEGKRIEDKHGHPISFNSYIENLTTTNYDLMVQNPSGNAGNAGEGTGGSGKHYKEPSTVEEFNTEKAKLNGKDLIEYHNKFAAKFDLKLF